MIEASAHNPSYDFFGKSEDVVRKQIDIREGYTYVNHSVSIVTANPKGESHEQWSYTEGVIKGEDGRVEAVWVEVRARNRSLFEGPVWVTARLAVTVEEPGAESGKGEATQSLQKAWSDSSKYLSKSFMTFEIGLQASGKRT